MTGKPLLVIWGATAVGKTDTAIALAQALDGEIIGADSRQLYRHMDIGTAKPTLEQRAQLPHHLIDLLEPDEAFGLADYQHHAYSLIDAIHVRDKLPLLVGGTGQYITAVIEGWSIPEVPPNPDLRAELEAYAVEHGSDALHSRLQTVDPAGAQLMEPQNVRRIVRALEVYMETGVPFSEQRRKTPPPYDVCVIGLTMDREALYERANARLDQMMQAGFLDEVRALLAEGIDPRLPSMSALGYPQLAAHVRGELSLDEALTAIRKATRTFIRRQYAWFRGHDHGTIWHDVTTLDPGALIDTTRAWLNEDDNS